MQLGKVSNVSFGCILTPPFVESTRWCHGNKPRGTLIYKLKNAGNDNIIIHTKAHQIYDNKDYDILIYPKYKYKERVYGGLRNIENLPPAEERAMEGILKKAAKKGTMKKVKEALIEDFPYLKKTIVQISKNPVLKKQNSIASRKSHSIFRLLLKSLSF